MELQYQGRTLTYVINRKNMKTVRVRVKEDGIIHVSAPPAASEAFIRRFLLENAAELVRLLDNVEKRKADAPDYTDGSAFPHLGGTLTLRYHSAPCPTVREQDTLHIFARNPQEAQLAVRQWEISECVELYKCINREVYEHFRKEGFEVPLAHIQIKEMVSRWGSCTAATGRISMNFRLMRYPIESIYGVFYHEYTHFLHQDHSPQFYELLLRMYPEYRRWDALLK